MNPKTCVMQVLRLSLEEAGRNQEGKMVVWVVREVDSLHVTGYWLSNSITSNEKRKAALTDQAPDCNKRPTNCSGCLPLG
jgi:hypothetical protein